MLYLQIFNCNFFKHFELLCNGKAAAKREGPSKFGSIDLSRFIKDRPCCQLLVLPFIEEITFLSPKWNQYINDC